MSNESENERIDLTQFEGITEGPWVYERLAIVTAYPHPLITVNQSEGDLRLRIGKIITTHDGHAIAKLPDLITELKRAYEEIDKLNRALSALNSSHFVKE
jgi:hypothetical protein